jgi:uncharacterized protein
MGGACRWCHLPSMISGPALARLQSGGREAVFGFFGKLIEVTEGSLHLDLHAVFADDEHGVALTIVTVSRGGRSVTVDQAHVFHLRDGKVVEYWDSSADQYAFDELIG